MGNNVKTNCYFHDKVTIPIMQPLILYKILHTEQHMHFVRKKDQCLPVFVPSHLPVVC